LDEVDIWDIDKNDDDNGEDDEDGNCDIWQDQQICLPIQHPLLELLHQTLPPLKKI
jgi:hypothetical protein